MNRIYSYIALLLTLGFCSMFLISCEDELEYPGAPIKDGVSLVDMQLGFQAFSPALGSRADGQALKTINSLWIVFYDRDNNFIEKREITSFTNVGLEDNARPDGAPSSEVKTGHVEFKTKVNNGYYYIYAVANFDMSMISDEDISSPDKLKSIDLTWKDGAVTQNAEMFGWFTEGTKEVDPGTKAPLVAVRSNQTKLHSWVKRAASKLTIAFDTDNLKENVYIYLKSITVKDVPTHCYLGRDNEVGQEGYTLSNDLTDGETLLFGNAKTEDKGKDDHGNWPVIASGTSVYGLYSDRNGTADQDEEKSKRISREHDDTAPALYFYENMQPDGIINTITDKRQDITGANKQVSFPDGTQEGEYDKGWKDCMKFGSYIELKAYYVNNGSEHPGKGDIIYRFMLGKDEITNYEAERNHHYRLTMKFNGNANDVDFHIDYKEEAKPGLYTPDTTYVSYLYNQPSTTNIRATPKPGYDFVSFEAIILDNQWIPYPDDSSLYNSTAWNMQVKGLDYYATNWTTDESKAEITDGLYYKRDSEMANNTEFGFLSLREVSTVTHNFGRNSVSQSQLVKNFRNAYFKRKLTDGSISTDVNGPLNWREFKVGIPTEDGSITTEDKVDGNYTFIRKTNPNNKEIDYVGIIPLFTRAKTLDPWAVYSGANPFYEHRRYARIKFIAHYKYDESSGLPKTDGDSYQDVSYTHVLQARRIDNPRGIYRRAGNTDEFEVMLCYKILHPTDTTEYLPVISQGPWTATIEKDPHNLVKLSTAGGVSVTGEGQSVSGRTLSSIKFKYTPNTTCPVGDAYGAIIAVTYHNNSCVHKILVRQGYSAHELGPHGTVKWSAFNVYDSKNLTRSPLSVGSLFRRYTDLSYPILEKNNDSWGVGVDPGSTAKFQIAGKDPTAWTSISANTDASANAFGSMSLSNHIESNNVTYRIPTFNEITELGIKDGDNKGQTDNPYVNDYNCAFGITYADGAKRTLTTSGAYSYTDYNNEGKDSPKGVRGVVVYSLSNGDNVHFPLGATGHGRRKSRGLNSAGTGHIKCYGYMRYGSVDYRLEGGANNYRPMAWDLPSQMGAAYWINSGTNNGIAIDFNFGNYMSYYLNRGDLYLNDDLPDALPIKPVL